jgi:CHAD domain-containing protein
MVRLMPSGISRCEACMSFAFKRKECIADGICRIARKQVDKALKTCAKNSAESIHTTRKQIKKVRALLRLVRCAVGKRQFENALDDLRQAAGYLAGPRDSHVKQQALEELTPSRGRRSASDAFAQIRAVLKHESSEQAEKFRAENGARKVRQILSKMPRKFARLNFKEEGWGILGPSIKKAYDAAQQARDCVLKDGGPEKFHEWRKRVKDLLYTVQLLEPIWPEQMSALCAEFEKLTELLGDDHDLEMLRQTVVKNSVNVDLEGETQRLLPLIEARQIEMRKSALKLGNRLFEEKPSAFSDRLHQYWKRWKSKKRNRSLQLPKRTAKARAAL